MKVITDAYEKQSKSEQRPELSTYPKENVVAVDKHQDQQGRQRYPLREPLLVRLEKRQTVLLFSATECRFDVGQGLTDEAPRIQDRTPSVMSS